MKEKEKDAERKYLSPPSAEALEEMRRDLVAEEPEFEEVTFVDAGETITVRRPNPRYKAPK